MTSTFELTSKGIQVALLLAALTSLFCGIPGGGTEALEATRSAILPVPTIPAPAQPTSPRAQKAVPESRARMVLRQRQHPAASIRFAARNGATDFTTALMSMKAHAEVDTTDTEPRYLKIFLPATPDNHRSPPAA